MEGVDEGVFSLNKIRPKYVTQVCGGSAVSLHTLQHSASPYAVVRVACGPYVARKQKYHY